MKIISITKQVKLISKKKFANAIFELKNKTYIVGVIRLVNSNSYIYLF